MNPAPPDPAGDSGTKARARYAKVKALFIQALELPDADRRAFLETACGEDEELRRAALALLSYQEEVDELEAPAGASDAAVDLDTPSLTQLGPYRILGTRGHGGMGMVYEAVHADEERRVALKVLRPGMVSAELQARFARETAVLRRLSHPGIAAFHDAGTFTTTHGDIPYISMEFVDGPSLRDYLREEQPDHRVRLALFAEICEAVEHAHAQGIVHRDLKPENILIDGEGRPKVLDFGVARLTDVDLRTATIATSMGQLVGTIRYMSPEQACGEQVGVASDIYTLGLVGYEMVTGAFPYEVPAEPIHQSIVAIVTATPRPPSSVADVPAELDAILLRALGRTPAERYPSAGRLAADVRHHLAGEPISLRTPGLPARLARRARRLPRAAILAGVAALLLAVLATIVQMPSIRQLIDRPVDTGRALRDVYVQLDQVDRRLHYGTRTRAGIVEAIAILQRTRQDLWEIEPQPFTPLLHRYSSWRLGEAHYFLGHVDHDVEAFGQSATFFTEAQQTPIDFSTLEGIDVSLPIYARIENLGRHHAGSGIALALTAMAAYQAPAENITASLRHCRRSLRTLEGYGADNYAPMRDVELRKKMSEDRALVLNQLADNCAALAAMNDSLPLFDEAFEHFARADTAQYLQHNWSAYGSLLHHHGSAYVDRAVTSGASADVDSALSRLDRALAVRTRTRSPIAFGATKIEIARALQVRGGRGDLQRASAVLDEAIKVFDASNRPLERAIALRHLADVRADIALLIAAVTPLDGASSLLTVAGDAITRRQQPIHFARLELTRGKVGRIRWQLDGNEEERGRSLALLRSAQTIIPRGQQPALFNRFQAEIELLTGTADR